MVIYLNSLARQCSSYKPDGAVASSLVNFCLKHGFRAAISLIPLLFALGHATGLVHVEALENLDHSIYDAKLRWLMPKTLDTRIVIVDIDDASLAEVGRWPWGKDKLARLTNEVMQHQKAAVLGFDMVFPESDDNAALTLVKQLSSNASKPDANLLSQLVQLQPGLDGDAQFALSLKDQRVVLGFHFNHDRSGRTVGQLPKATQQGSLLPTDAGKTDTGKVAPWHGFTSNIELLANTAPQAGFLNVSMGQDTVVRSVPLRAAFKAESYDSLALAIYRINNQHASKAMPSALASAGALLVSFRGLGGAKGGSFQYVSAADLLANRLPPEQLNGKIVLIGSSAPSLQDLHTTPMGTLYPGVEIQANVLSSLLDDRKLYKPDNAWGIDTAALVLVGLVLAFALPALSGGKALGLSLGVILLTIAANMAVFRAQGMVLPLAALLTMAVFVYVLNTAYGYFVEKRTERDLTQLLGSYVPPQLIERMLKDPDSHVMKATNKDLTVMFCDLRGFTQLGQDIPPTQLQHLLNDVFSRLSHIILQQHGTVDKYMGDCIMAFWGAPETLPNHAELAVKSALAIIQEVKRINVEHQAKHLPIVRLGIGINTGVMCVGDMGSSVRRSYTVVGDAVNVASRLESLTKTYKLDLLAGFSTTLSAPMFDWVLIDTVQLAGKTNLLATYTVRNYTKA
jgi:adenylate cyclase